MTLNFPKLEPWLQDVYEDVSTAYGSGKVFTVKSRRLIGKTTLMCILLVTYAVLHPGCRSIVIEPSNTHNRNVYKEIKNWLYNTGVVSKFNDSVNELVFINNSVIVFKSAESRDRLRGDRCSGLLAIDEAQFIHPDILEMVLPYADAAKAPTLLISTPLFADPANMFYKFFTDPDGVTSFSYDWSDPKYDTSKYLSAEKLEFYRRNMTEFKFKTEILGLFISDGGYVFKNIYTCVGETDDRIVTVAGIDFGTGSNGDYTVITLMNAALQVVDVFMCNDKDPTAQIDWLADIINDYPTLTTVLAEKNSIGAVYISSLKKKLLRPAILRSFTTTNTSKKDIIENLVQVFANGTIMIPENVELIRQLQHYQVQKLSNGNYTYNAMQGHHDDCVISLALALHALQKKSTSYKNTIKFL